MNINIDNNDKEKSLYEKIEQALNKSVDGFLSTGDMEDIAAIESLSNVLMVLRKNGFT